MFVMVPLYSLYSYAVVIVRCSTGQVVAEWRLPQGTDLPYGITLAWAASDASLSCAFLVDLRPQVWLMRYGRGP